MVKLGTIKKQRKSQKEGKLARNPLPSSKRMKKD